MEIEKNIYPVTIDGRPVQAADLAPLAFAGFAHFTAMQVRDRKLKGVDLHLARLRHATMALFGHALDDQQVLPGLRSAIAAGPPDVSLTATVFPSKGEFTARSMGAKPSILIRSGPPSDGPTGPLRLWMVEHERHQAGIKHVGEGAKTYYLHRAVEQGFDDAAFVDRHGRLSEASIWNLAFWDGAAVVWPRADLLRGTTMGIVQRQLERMGVAQRLAEIRAEDLAQLTGAVVMNSWTPGVPVSAIGSAVFTRSPELAALLRRAYDAEPYLPL